MPIAFCSAVACASENDTLKIQRNCQKGQQFAAPDEPGIFGISAKQVSELSEYIWD